MQSNDKLDTTTIPTLPFIEIGPISLSAPSTRRPSRPSTPTSPRKAQSASMPTSPKQIVKTRLHARRNSEPPVIPTSPARSMRKHTRHVSFGGEVRYNKSKAVVNDEGVVLPEMQLASCPVHAYGSMDAPLSSAREAAVFGTAVRDILAAARTDACPVHSYSDMRSTLTRRNSASFGDAERELLKATVAPCPVHAYATPKTTLRKAGAVAFGSTSRRDLVPIGRSRTGLLTATITPRPPEGEHHRAARTTTPRTMKLLPHTKGEALARPASPITVLEAEVAA